MQTDEEIKKEFKERFDPIIYFDGTPFYGDHNQVAEELEDWWLLKFHTLQEEYKKQILEKIMQVPHATRDEVYQENEFLICRDDLLNIIKQ